MPETLPGKSENPTDEFPAPVPRLQPAKVQFAAMTHVGKVRKNNEDQYLVARLKKTLEVLDSSLPAEEDDDRSDLDAHVFLVADGIGGAEAGEHASAFVVREAKKHMLHVSKWFFRLDDPDEEVRLRLLRESLERLDRTLIEEAQRNPNLTGMGTTLTAASSVGLDLLLLQVGDSRAYLFRDGQLTQLTRDQTLAQEMIDDGVLNPETAKKHHSRHMLTNAIGGMPGVHGEFLKIRLAFGDRLLLSTDGMHDLVGDQRIAEILATQAEPKPACTDLVAAALEQGGRDNITVIVVNYLAEDE